MIQIFVLIKDNLHCLLEIRFCNTSFCIVLNVSNSVADIISDFQSYNICLIDNEEDPDLAAREQIVQRQVIVEVYDFITNLLDVAFCVAEPGFGDYLGLLFNFIGIFPSPPPEPEE